MGRGKGEGEKKGRVGQGGWIWGGLNPIRSGGGALKAPPPSDFCLHAFNFGAILFFGGDFSKKIV